jgi:hypothetical protein
MEHAVVLTFTHTALIDFNGIPRTYALGLSQVFTNWTKQPPRGAQAVGSLANHFRQEVRVRDRVFTVTFLYPHRADDFALKITGICYPSFLHGTVQETFDGEVLRIEDDDNIYDID